MNCQQFERIVVDLAREGALDAERPPGALDHVRECPRCAMGLSDQRKLAKALRAVNVAASNEQAPANVEHSLLRAFRGRLDASRPATVQAASPRRSGAVAWPVWAVAAAALLLLGLVAGWKMRPAASVHGLERPSSAPPVTNEKAGLSTVRNGDARSASAAVHDAVSLLQTAKHRAPSQRVGTPGERAAAEATTRFYPLPYGSGLGLDEGWGLVRVQVPRASLESLGLPVSAGAANEMLTADVVVGQDGLARGIRFVQ
jgi:hypothetical protein